jgi:hypothetical protein
MAYRDRELQRILPVLTQFGFDLDKIQPHLGGERFLGSADKLVLVGKRVADNKPVIIKLSSELTGKAELNREHAIRTALARHASSHDLLAPETLLFTDSGGNRVLVSEYLTQDQNFASRPLEEQFRLALTAFEAQGRILLDSPSSETLRDVLPIVESPDYMRSFAGFVERTMAQGDPRAALTLLLRKAARFLDQNRDALGRDCGVLAHSDFVPHNFRVVSGKIYFLDHASFLFGNRYESWARFTNNMTSRNRALESMLLDHVRVTRGPDAYLGLRLMRVYKLGFLLALVANAVDVTSGDLHVLSKLRMDFYAALLDAVLGDFQLSESFVTSHIRSNDELRSLDEKRRRDVIQ